MLHVVFVFASSFYVIVQFVLVFVSCFDVIVQLVIVFFSVYTSVRSVQFCCNGWENATHVQKKGAWKEVHQCAVEGRALGTILYSIQLLHTHVSLGNLK